MYTTPASASGPVSSFPPAAAAAAEADLLQERREGEAGGGGRVMREALPDPRPRSAWD